MIKNERSTKYKGKGNEKPKALASNPIQTPEPSECCTNYIELIVLKSKEAERETKHLLAHSESPHLLGYVQITKNREVCLFKLSVPVRRKESMNS